VPARRKRVARRGSARADADARDALTDTRSAGRYVLAGQVWPLEPLGQCSWGASIRSAVAAGGAPYSLRRSHGIEMDGAGSRRAAIDWSTEYGLVIPLICDCW
jgi:hypothetical protein